MTDRRRGRVALVEIVAVLALAGIVWLLFFPDSEDRTPEALTRMRLDALAGAIRDYHRTSGVLPDAAPDGRWIYNLHREGRVVPPYIVNMPRDYYTLDDTTRTGTAYDASGGTVAYRIDDEGAILVGSDEKTMVRVVLK